MSQDIDKNKIGDRQKRQAERIQDNLEDQGMGRDEAEKRAVAAVADQPSGGHNTGGERRKGANHEDDHRTGSESNAS